MKLTFNAVAAGVVTTVISLWVYDSFIKGRI